MAIERSAIMSARRELEALKVAHDASLLLYDVLTPLEGPSADWTHPRGRQKIAVGFLSAIALRSSRAAMAIIGHGYVPEAIGLKRRIGEAAARTEKVLNDKSGEYARRWIEGQSPGGALARDPLLWKAYSAGTHADIRMMGLEVDEIDGATRLRVPVMPERQPDLANALLTEIAVEVLDQAAMAVEWVAEREFTAAERNRGDKIVAAIEPLRERYFDGAVESVTDAPATDESPQ
jgi:hypothetical protein